jgi:hypothetical protein
MSQEGGFEVVKVKGLKKESRKAHNPKEGRFTSARIPYDATKLQPDIANITTWGLSEFGELEISVPMRWVSQRPDRYIEISLHSHERMSVRDFTPGTVMSR